MASRLVQAISYVGVVIGSLLVNGTAVALLWVAGTNLTTIDNPLPGQPGVLVYPMLLPYRLLSVAVLAANAGLLLYLLVRRRYRAAVAFAAGAAVPMGYLGIIVVTT